MIGKHLGLLEQGLQWGTQIRESRKGRSTSSPITITAGLWRAFIFVLIGIFLLRIPQAQVILDLDLDGEPYRIYVAHPHEILSEITPMVLGSVNQSSLVEGFGRYLGTQAIHSNCEAAVVGTTKTLSLDDEDFYLSFSASPYLTAQTLRDLSWGVLSSGVFPVLDLRTGYNPEVIRSLIARKVFPGLLIDENQWPDPFIRESGLGVVTSDGQWMQNPYEWKRFSWKGPEVSPDPLRIQLLTHSITLIKRTRSFDTFTIIQEDHGLEIIDRGVILYLRPDWMDPKLFHSGVVVYSLDPKVIQEASEVLMGIQPARGRKSW